ncbi:MAG: YabP/YqfC family sporulation protein [Mycoplasma sp.]|nr:YabP/YqfC family sporulation protein [Mycoplasma sp.]
MLNIKNTIIDFLYDKNYFITMYENFLYIYNFQEIITLTNELIMLSIENFKIKITGSDLKIKKINSCELLIEGNIISIGKIYE